MNREDYNDIKNMLLDDYKKTKPSPIEQRAYVTGMTRFEQALAVLKEMLLKEYRQENPSSEQEDAFWFGMEDFEGALLDRNTEERLNDFLPVRIDNDYLREQLKGAMKILAENDELRRLNEGLNRKILNDSGLSKAEISQLKKDTEYIRISEELKKCRAEKAKFQDLYYSLMIEKYNKEKQNK